MLKRALVVVLLLLSGVQVQVHAQGAVSSTTTISSTTTTMSSTTTSATTTTTTTSTSTSAMSTSTSTTATTTSTPTSVPSDIVVVDAATDGTIFSIPDPTLFIGQPFLFSYQFTYGLRSPPDVVQLRDLESPLANVELVDKSQRVIVTLASQVPRNKYSGSVIVQYANITLPNVLLESGYTVQMTTFINGKQSRVFTAAQNITLSSEARVLQTVSWMLLVAVVTAFHAL